MQFDFSTVNSRYCIVGACSQGGRQAMEDISKAEINTGEQACFLAIFDGHGGREAAQYTCDHLWDNIKSVHEYQSSEPEDICKAITSGFIQTRDGMREVVSDWISKYDGYPSTSGTTASCIILRSLDSRLIYIANVGDSQVVMGKASSNCGETKLTAEVITKNHTPDDKEEARRIEQLGGTLVKQTDGTTRVAWKRKRDPEGCSNACKKHCIESIPFLNMTRSIGDFWSATETNDFLISPIPDVHVQYLDDKVKFFVIASDGLWDVMNSQEVVDEIAKSIETNDRRDTIPHILIKKALNKWNKRQCTADNISVLILFIY